ncbi:MAG: DNA polymerase IV [Lachnospiraceae bacterium]|jgi:DNA polymerase-4|nr:DNA polymerase IV [Lachnospiraceae bacterium]
MDPNRLIFHIDVNSAFLSWESVYRLEKNPKETDLRTIPSVVGGDSKSRHGVVLAKSTPAKKYGVETGEPLISARKKCPELVIVPSRFDFYQKCSRKLISLLESYTPDIEKFSIDEAFLDMTETIHLFGSPVNTANQIRELIHKELKFTVNIGVSSNKLLAKMASDFQKPNRTHTLFSEEIQEKMWPLPLRELFLVGSAAAEKMQRIGLHTIGDVAACDLGILKAHLGNKYGTLIHQYANGIDEDPVESKEPANKGYGNSITLPRDVDDYDTACQVLLALSETVGARLREENVRCNCICVELKDWQFNTQSHQLTLNTPTDSTTALYHNACQLLKEFWDLTPVRLIGLRTSRISEDSYEQMSLFENAQSKKMKELEKAVDRIRIKYGTDSIKRASFLKEDALVDHAVSKKKHLPFLEMDPDQ